MSHTTLEEYYDLLYALRKTNRYETHEYEALIVFERDLYVERIAREVREKNQGV